MFRWCAYCCRFLGERAPFEDFTPTHGLCGECETRGTMTDSAAIARVRPILALHDRLLAEAARTDGGETPAEEVLEEGRRLGIRPLDLLMGVIQPLLYEIGRRWEDGKIERSVEAR